MTFGVVDEKIRPPTVQAVDRARLDAKLARRDDRRQVGLLVAPPGSGKTTLLARFCARADFPVAWFQADAADSDPCRLLAYLDAAVARVRPGFGKHSSIDELVAELCSSPEPLGLVIDDLHTMQGTPAEDDVDRLVRYFPRGGMLLIASRSAPSFDLSKLRLADQLIEIDGDTMRFRTWEVEQLFRDLYSTPLPPVELAELSRRTNGWAAGLQLFHLATAGKPASERRATLHGLTRSRFLRDYLTRNVLADLPVDLRKFLLDTCVLTVMTPELCDAFLGRGGSGKLLAELDRRQIFTTAIDDTGTYRYHDVLRSHLQSILVDEIGEARLRERFNRAGEVLAAAGQQADAVTAYARAGDADRVAALLNDAGHDLALTPGDWIDALPPAVAENDAWVMLAAARWHLRAGRWQEAADSYRRGIEQFGAEPVAEILRSEHTAIQAFDHLRPGVEHTRPDSWDRVLLAALQQNPASLVEPIDDSSVAALAAGLAAMLAGWPDRAVALLDHAANHPDIGPMAAAGARLAAAAAPHWAPGTPVAGQHLADVVAEVEEPGGPWLGILGMAALALISTDGPAPQIDRGPLGEPWSNLLSHYLGAVGAVAHAPEDALDRFELAAKEARAQGTATIEAWARAGAAYAAALAGSSNAAQLSYGAEAAARAAGVPGARAVAFAALAIVDPSSENCQLALATSQECGLQLSIPPPPEPPGATCRLRCLGGLRLVVDDIAMDLTRLKPRWRSLLGLLAAHQGRPVHRDTIIAALWPEADDAAGLRSLQVSVSGVRGCLDQGREGQETMVARIGDAYALHLPEGSWSDLAILEHALAAANEARRSGDLTGAVHALSAALDVYEGDLLPEEGAAEWVLEPREQHRSGAIGIAALLAASLLEAGNPEGARQAAAAGLRIDRYRDDLWRLQITALEQTGDTAQCDRVRAAYDEVLAELGVT